MEITNRLTDICFLRSRPHHGQHTYNVGKFKFYLYQAGWWFSPGTSVSSINKTDRNHITEILLKVALNTITLTLTPIHILCSYWKFYLYHLQKKVEKRTPVELFQTT
jgi:hypothetical protein